MRCLISVSSGSNILQTVLTTDNATNSFTCIVRLCEYNLSDVFFNGLKISQTVLMIIPDRILFQRYYGAMFRTHLKSCKIILSLQLKNNDFTIHVLKTTFCVVNFPMGTNCHISNLKLVNNLYINIV